MNHLRGIWSSVIFERKSTTLRWFSVLNGYENTSQHMPHNWPQSDRRSLTFGQIVEKPKSINIICPLSSITTFFDCKSARRIFKLCISSIATTISATIRCAVTASGRFFPSNREMRLPPVARSVSLKHKRCIQTSELQDKTRFDLPITRNSHLPSRHAYCSPVACDDFLANSNIWQSNENELFKILPTNIACCI